MMRDGFRLADMGSTLGRKSIRMALLGSALLTLAGCLGYDGDLQHGYVLEDHQLDQVKPGSSAEQVLVVMGTPSTTSTVGGTAWYYISQKTAQSLAFMQPKITDRRIIAIYFDKNKRVERVANYGLEDGRVIDFISRTTPTAGAEASFLANAFKNLMRF
jgi:outer membrane protein assembly factor BamE (lipoprotein component of BamABCDE complex)